MVVPKTKPPLCDLVFTQTMVEVVILGVPLLLAMVIERSRLASSPVLFPLLNFRVLGIGHEQFRPHPWSKSDERLLTVLLSFHDQTWLTPRFQLPVAGFSTKPKSVH
ncbi:hypothetical protein L6452_43427 [Arctium lappa]|uniref:Uncharacterized protein n=1 Tax=Arctium lappa TaxID=4217 RepID=A0ACB8XDE2_ARCLA|nr:hypothetical protein L6452_43427 [Arctium lappa]